MKAQRIRHQFYLDPAMTKALDELARAPGATKSAVLEAALRVWIAQRGANALDERFGQRLNRLSQTLQRVERDQKIVVESLALFVRTTLQRDAHLPEPDAEARARGRAQFDAFIDQVGIKIAQGRATFTSTEDPQP